MITNDDVKLSKLSYTNADFAELYPDLLTLAKNLTNKWDPSLSNESDPGVVLLKHAAFVGDHNNYNTDKNTLEAFLPTATQDRSVRNIVEMNGYTPRYYISASGRVAFNYKADMPDVGQGPIESFNIPAFTIVVSNEDGTVNYTQIEPLDVIGTNKTTSTLFMEGTLQVLSINNEQRLTMENIDSNNRVYFPDAYVAQNGVFVENISGNSIDNVWTRNNYLLTQPKGTKVFKIDFDSAKGLPYIEFPNDIASLIGDGLIVKYLSTSGLAGNVNARELNTIKSPSTFEISNYNITINFSDFELRNNSSITNGKDPETIDEMYQSFKKVVGTFNTLVTSQDYSNALYTSEDNLGNNYLGNVVVTDVRNDYNRAGNFVTYDDKGIWYKNLSIGEAVLSAYNFKYVDTTSAGYIAEPGDVKVEDGELLYYSYDGEWKPLNDLTKLDFTSYINGLSPYDLVIHALNAYSKSDYDSFKPYYAIEKSFKKPLDSTIKTAVDSIEDLQCINHTFEYIDTDQDVYLFKEYAPIKVMLTPYNKLSKFEKLEIQDNIYRALSNKYNSRMVDWGEPINEEILQRDILNADDRIRSVEVKPINYVPKAARLVVNTDNSEFPGVQDFQESELVTDQGLITDLVAKNFLAGRICLFNFDDSFEYNYGQGISAIEKTSGGSTSEDVSPIIHDIASISTDLEISLADSADSQITDLTNCIYKTVRITQASKQLSISNPRNEYAKIIGENGESSYKLTGITVLNKSGEYDKNNHITSVIRSLKANTVYYLWVGSRPGDSGSYTNIFDGEGTSDSFSGPVLSFEINPTEDTEILFSNYNINPVTIDNTSKLGVYITNAYLPNNWSSGVPIGAGEGPYTTWSSTSYSLNENSRIILPPKYGIAIGKQDGTAIQWNVYLVNNDKGLIIDTGDDTSLTLPNNTAAISGSIKAYYLGSAQYSYGDQPEYSIEPIDIGSIINEGDSQEGTTPTSTYYDYTLQDNEYFIVKNRNYTATRNYGSYITYIFESSGNEAKVIKPNTFYRLQAGEKLIFIYKGSNDQYLKDEYGPNTVIRSTFDIKDINHSGLFKQKVIVDGITYQCNSVPAGARISICEPLRTDVNSNDVKCYWILNNASNQLFKSGQEYRDLDQDEYFIYATKSESQMVIFGSGTRIKRTNINDGYSWICNKTNITSINSNGFKSNIDWQTYNFSINPLEIYEYSILVLGPGDSFSLSETPILTTNDLTNISGSLIALNSSWKEYNGNIEYITKSGSNTLYKTTEPYYIKTRLDISTGPDNPQKIIATSQSTSAFEGHNGVTSSSTQRVILITNAGEYTLAPTYDSTTETYIPMEFQTDKVLDIVGGQNISTSYSDGSMLEVYNYKNEPIKELVYNDESWEEGTKEIPLGVDGVSITISKDPTGVSLPFQYYSEKNSMDESIQQFIIPMYVNSSAPSNISVEVKDNDGLAENIEIIYVDDSNIQYYDDEAQSEDDRNSLQISLSSSNYNALKDNQSYKLIFEYKYGSGDNDKDKLEFIFTKADIIVNSGGGETSYILKFKPVFLNGDWDTIKELSPVPKATITDPITWSIHKFNCDEDDMDFSKSGMYLLVINSSGGEQKNSHIENEETSSEVAYSGEMVTTIANLKILVKVLDSINERTGSILIKKPVVVTGLNGNLQQYTNMSDVLDRIKYLVQHASQPDIQVYYINRPDNELAIENDDILNLFDKNNVANPTTIAQLDFYGEDSYIEVVKSMMKE